MFPISPLERILYRAMMQGKVWLDWFCYSANWNTLGASASTNQQTPINADSDFVIKELNLCAFSSPGTVVANPDYTLTLLDSGSGRQLSDGPIHVSNMTGQNRNNAWPFVMPMSKVISASAIMTATLVNNTSTAAVVQLAYAGYKVFYFGTTLAALIGAQAAKMA